MKKKVRKAKPRGCYYVRDSANENLNEKPLKIQLVSPNKDYPKGYYIEKRINDYREIGPFKFQHCKAKRKGHKNGKNTKKFLKEFEDRDDIL